MITNDEDKIKERLETLNTLFCDMKQDLSLDSVYICPHTLNIAVHSYFQDIERYKSYHGMTGKLIDEPKQAAFTGKWLYRTRPVLLCATSHEVSEESLFANEFFILKTMLAFAKIKEKKINDTLMGTLLYSLKYRTISEDGLILLMLSLS